MTNDSADPVNPEKIVRKIRWRLIPFLFLLYVIAFLDRINIGFAALTMNAELGITAQQFGLVAGIFFLGYSTCEIPSNILLHKLGARIWIARILIVWGIVAALTGLVHSVHQLYVARFLLGVAEAGYFPGIVLYLTYWFRQRDQAQAIALFMTALPVSSVIGAPLSGLILDHVHWLGASSWRWLLVLEGIPAIACGVLTYFLLPSRPAEARFLTEAEKDWVVNEVSREEGAKRAKTSALHALANKRGVVSGLNSVLLRYRDVRAEFLDAASREVVCSESIEHNHRIVAHDSLCGRRCGNDSDFTKLGSQNGKAISHSRAHDRCGS